MYSKNADFGPMSVNKEIFIVGKALNMGQCHIMIKPIRHPFVFKAGPSIYLYHNQTFYVQLPMQNHLVACISLYIVDQMLLLMWSLLLKKSIATLS